jgi:hypothetical protein
MYIFSTVRVRQLFLARISGKFPDLLIIQHPFLFSLGHPTLFRFYTRTKKGLLGTDRKKIISVPALHPTDFRIRMDSMISE